LEVIVIEGSAAVRNTVDMIDLARGGDAAFLEAGAAKRFLAEVDRSEPLPPWLRVELAHCSSPSLACSVASVPKRGGAIGTRRFTALHELHSERDSTRQA